MELSAHQSPIARVVDRPDRPASATGSRRPGKPACGRGWKTIWTASPNPPERSCFRSCWRSNWSTAAPRASSLRRPITARGFRGMRGEIDAAVSGKLALVGRRRLGDRPFLSLRSLHIVCPHCRNPIEIRDNITLAKIVCPKCGGTFGLADDDAAAYGDARRHPPTAEDRAVRVGRAIGLRRFRRGLEGQRPAARPDRGHQDSPPAAQPRGDASSSSARPAPPPNWCIRTSWTSTKWGWKATWSTSSAILSRACRWPIGSPGSG